MEGVSILHRPSFSVAVRASFKKVVSKHFIQKRSKLFITEQINANSFAQKMRKAIRDLL
jgi:hypothetical protein